MVGLVTALRVILRHWNTTVCPELKDGIRAMAETASYESMLNKLKNDAEDKDKHWDYFWNYLKQTENHDHNAIM